MPAEKRPAVAGNGETSTHFRPKQRRHDVVEGQADADADADQSHRPRQQIPTPTPEPEPEPEKEEQDVDAASDEDLDADDTGDLSEFAYVDLQAIRKEVQCPICLGIIKKTRTVMECLHRFCRECIDKSMRMGNNECPACRTHCPSRRSLRDDPRYDAIIAALYPDIKNFEEEELAFREEDEARNKHIQESISHVLRKQSEALGKKRPANKDTSGTSVGRSQRNYQTAHSRRRRRRRSNASIDYQDSDDDDYARDSDIQFFPDDHHPGIKQSKRKSRASIRSSYSPSSTNLSGGSFEDDQEQSKNTEMLAWGKGGVRSNNRHTNSNGGINRNVQRNRLAKLVDFLHNLEENDEKCIALQTQLKAENAQMLGIQDPKGSCDHQSTFHISPCNNDILGREENLSGAVSSCISNAEQMIPTYQQKEAM